MPIRYVLDREVNVIFETWTGAVTASDLSKYWKAYLADPEVLRCRRTLVDLRECSIEFSGEELSQLVSGIVVPRLGPMKWRSALLVSAPVQFGVSRQYAVFAETYSRDAIFYDHQVALDWLLQGDADGA